MPTHSRKGNPAPSLPHCPTHYSFKFSHLIAALHPSKSILRLCLIKSSIAVIIIHPIFIFKRLGRQNLVFLVINGWVVWFGWRRAIWGLVSSRSSSCSSSKKEDLRESTKFRNNELQCLRSVYRVAKNMSFFSWIV